MINAFLKEVIVYVAGKPAENITEILSTKKHVNEFLIAKKIDLTINQTRNILYKISDNGLVSSIRKKDNKKGWYTYFWKIENLKSLEFLKQVLLKQIEQINNHIKSRESKQFYICERCNIELTEENALLHNFTCNECGDVFKIKDNFKLLREFKKNLEKLKNKIYLIDQEIEKEKGKIEKQKVVEGKKLDKEKAKETIKKGLARKKLAEMNLKNKKATLKKPKKKKSFKQKRKKAKTKKKTGSFHASSKNFRRKRK